MRTKTPRRKLFTGRPAQTKFLVLIIVSMLLPLVVIGGCLYYLIFTVLAEQLGIPESIAVNLFPVIEKINIILLVAMPPICALIVWWGAFLSHRFFGPLERLERDLERLAQSDDYTKRIVLRKTDDLRPVADRINALLDAFQRKRR